MSHWPTPSVEAEIFSERLTQRLKKDIQQQGWISFAEFMHRALYEPGLGYYVAGNKKIGAEGDFITAPEISSAFSQCIARQIQEIFCAIQGGSILEFGAGTGIMAADILLELEKQQCLPEKYFILEVSPDLWQCQQEMLQKKCPHLLYLVFWLNTLPKDFAGVVLANEVLDAMPVHCFEIQDGKAYEKGVTMTNEQFAWKINKNVVLDVETTIPHGCSNGYSSEICFAIKPWLEALYSSIKRGIVLIIDYGFPASEYYHPDRYQGTLMCHYRHRAHTDPFIFVGLQDITAHVDFTAATRAATKAGFSVAGYTNQANFLMSLNILTNTTLDAFDEQQQYAHAQAIKKLLLPSEMGELFKVLALSKNMDIALQGFQLRNDKYRHNLYF